MSGKKVNVQVLINIILVVTLLLVIGFGWYYFRGVNPVEEVTATVVTPEIPSYEFEFSIYGGEKDFKKPREVLVFEDSIYVSDTGNSRIVVFDMNGKLVREITHKELQAPGGLFWDGSSLWVCDATIQKIFVFTPQGDLLDTWDLEKNNFVADLVVNEGFLYLLNNGNMVVEKYDLSSKEKIHQFAGYGKEEGRLYFPYSITINNNTVYVADSLNNRINLYDLEGKFINQWAKHPEEGKSATLSVPRGLAFDSSGRLFTVEGVGHNVSVLNSDGEVISKINKTETIGEEVQTMNLPTDVAVDSLNRLYVLEHSFRRVLVYKTK